MGMRLADVGREAAHPGEHIGVPDAMAALIPEAVP
jgi:hypothetical protein